MRRSHAGQFRLRELPPGNHVYRSESPLPAVLDHEAVEVSQMPPPQSYVAALFRLQTFAIPIALQEILGREHPPHLLRLRARRKRPVGRHDVQQRRQRRTSLFVGAVLVVLGRDVLVGLDDVLDAVGERLRVLRFRPQDRVIEDLRRIVEHAAEEHADKPARDPIAQPAGQNQFAIVPEILQPVPAGPRGSARRDCARQA